MHVCVCSLCRLHLWIIYCDFLKENWCNCKTWLAERERDEIEKENERETLSKHWRKTREQGHPYLLCRGWDSQTAGQVCLLLVWSMTPCHSMCYVDFFAENGIGKTTHKAYVCRNTSVLTWSVQIHYFMRKTYLIVLNTILLNNKVFICNPNKSSLAYGRKNDIGYSYFKQSLQAWFYFLNLLKISGMNQTPLKCTVLYILC